MNKAEFESLSRELLHRIDAHEVPHVDTSHTDSSTFIGHIAFPTCYGLAVEALTRLQHMWEARYPGVKLNVVIRNYRNDDGLVEPILAIQVELPSTKENQNKV